VFFGPSGYPQRGVVIHHDRNWYRVRGARFHLSVNMEMARIYPTLLFDVTEKDIGYIETRAGAQWKVGPVVDGCWAFCSRV